ncbi:uncharacterized protein LOC121761060 isoform X3 [Salvia splendens]|uniref:uncharacterized protein LOC121761060 isoform X3 n=1 Tax=Salvia splendens TaxID=180675 RepID=UPI001C25C1E3|nr:uncharacterized protein LOC121761060 isoform X3 [Salvia splendens]
MKVASAASGLVWNVMLLAMSLVCSSMMRVSMVELGIHRVSSDLNICRSLISPTMTSTLISFQKMNKAAKIEIEDTSNSRQRTIKDVHFMSALEKISPVCVGQGNTKIQEVFEKFQSSMRVQFWSFNPSS